MHRPHRALGVLFLLWGMILAVGGTWFASLLFSGTDHELPWFLALSAGLFVSGAGMGTVIASRGRTVRFVTSSGQSLEVEAGRLTDEEARRLYAQLLQTLRAAKQRLPSDIQ